MFEVFRVSCGYCLVKKAMCDISMSVSTMTFTEEVEVAEFATSLHRLDDEIDSDETLPRFDEVEGSLEPFDSHPSCATSTLNNNLRNGN